MNKGKTLMERRLGIGRELMAQTTSTTRWRWYHLSKWGREFGKSLFAAIGVLPLILLAVLDVILAVLLSIISWVCDNYPRVGNLDGLCLPPFHLLCMDCESAKDYIYQRIPELKSKEPSE